MRGNSHVRFLGYPGGGNASRIPDNPKVKYEKALCLMVNIVPEASRICDTDKRAVKHVFNIIANMRIVKDDSWQYMSYVVETRERGTRPITEIYVID